MTRHTRRLATFAASFAAVLGLVAVPAHADRPISSAKSFPAYEGLEPGLGGRRGVARVLIHVDASTTASVADYASHRLLGQLAAQPTRAELDALADASSARRTAIAAGIEDRRHDALDRLQPAVDVAIDGQDRVVAAITRAGARILERDPLTGTITAEVPRRDLRTLLRRDDVTAITAAPADKPLNMLSESSSIMGAPSFWRAGFLGGRGTNDTTGPDLALIGDRIYQHHPAFAGITFQTPKSAPALCEPTIVGCAHGTQVAGVAFSQGVAGTGTASDADQKGIAPGVDTVLDAELEYWTASAWLLGFDQSGGDGLHAPEVGASDPAEVVNASYGTVPSEDDTPGARAFDNFAAAFGITSGISAGNRGPSSRSLSSPCIAYDSICAGAVRLGVGETAADMTIAEWSSRGPSLAGRKKPDLVAIGTVDTASPKWQSDGKLWAGVTGTSFAAPQVAGAATLLAGSGVTHHLAHKSVLINSARQGRKTPTDVMGTQIDWQPDWGWGVLDLSAALGQRSAVVPSTTTKPGIAGHHAVTEITEGDVHFYSATTQAAGDRATLVWDRRAVACINIGCPEGSYGMTLTNLGLSETSADGTGLREERPSSIDNVEQVRSPGAADVIYKVRALSRVDGVTSEPYSLAATRPIKRLATPRPKVTVTATATEATSAQDVTFTARIVNPSPDLVATGVNATLELPDGAQLAHGSASRSIGSLAAGASSTQSWTVRFAQDGQQTVKVAVAATALGESLPASASQPVLIDSIAPAPSINAPSGSRTDGNLPITWAASDSGVGVASYDVEVSIDSTPFAPWLTATTSTSGTYTATLDSSYQFRSRSRDRLGNESAWTTGPTVSIVNPPPPTATPTPAPLPKPTATLRISRAKLATGKLTVSGAITKWATGRVALRFSSRSRGKTYTAKLTRTVSRGRFTATLKLKGTMRKATSGKLTVSYGGDSGYAAATASKAVRRRP